MTWDELFRRIGEGVFLFGAAVGGLFLFLFTLALILWGWESFTNRKK